MTKWNLMQSLFNATIVSLIVNGGRVIANVVVDSIEREDGSGKGWNVTYHYKATGLASKCFVRTID